MASKATHVCGLCKLKQAQYTCPRCQVHYCSLTCYKAPSHVHCSESFYHQQIQQQLHNHRATEGSREQMLAMLKRLDDQDQRQLLDECGPGSAEESEEEEEIDSDDDQDLADRLAGVDLDDSDAVWERLTEEERRQFQDAVQSGDVTAILPSFTPWWLLNVVGNTEQDGKNGAVDTCRIVELSETEAEAIVNGSIKDDLLNNGSKDNAAEVTNISLETVNNSSEKKNKTISTGETSTNDSLKVDSENANPVTSDISVSESNSDSLRPSESVVASLQTTSTKLSAKISSKKKAKSSTARRLPAASVIVSVPESICARYRNPTDDSNSNNDSEKATNASPDTSDNSSVNSTQKETTATAVVFPSPCTVHRLCELYRGPVNGSIAYSIAEVLYCYAWMVRLYQGRHRTAPLECMEGILTLSDAFSLDRSRSCVHKHSLESALATVDCNALLRPWLGGSCVDTEQDMPVLLGLSSEGYTTHLALADMLSISNAAISTMPSGKASQSPKDKSPASSNAGRPKAAFSALFPSETEDIEIQLCSRKSLLAASAKLQFFLAFAEHNRRSLVQKFALEIAGKAPVVGGA